MTADPLAAELARTREQLRRAEDEIRDLRADNARLRARQTTDLVLPEQGDGDEQRCKHGVHAKQGLCLYCGMDNQIDNQMHKAKVVDLPEQRSEEPQVGQLPGVGDLDEPICGSEPPADGNWGDCWCTLPPDHEGLCFCEPCTERHGAPGWDGGAA